MKQSSYFRPSMGKTILLIIFSFASVFVCKAQNLKGKITDAKTGEPLVGASVEVEKQGIKLKTTVNLDGSYIFRNLPAAKYELKVKFVGYKTTKEYEVVVGANQPAILDLQMQGESTELEGVKVTARSLNTTDNAVRHMEKNADIVQNIMSQRSIELSPDVTVANSLQRMSGVAIQRGSSGEGKYAIIRGMDQRYNTTLVNGIKIPSPDDKYRYVPMDIFPSDLLERLEVVKALTPAMEADAVGGVMNLIMKNAPGKELFTAFVASGSSTLFNDRPFTSFTHGVINKKDPSEINGPAPGYLAKVTDFPAGNLNFVPKSSPLNLQTGFTYGNRLFKKRLGFILGVGYQNNYRGSDQVLNTQYPGAKILPNAGGVTGNIYNNYPQFNDAINNQYSNQQRRVGINNKWDYSFNSNNKISLFNMYVRMDEYQARFSSDTDVNTNLGNIKFVSRSRWQIQNIYNSTLQGDHIIASNLTLNWSAVYSIAKQQIPDQAQFEYDNKKNSDGTFQYPLTTGVLKGMDRTWSHNTDQDIAGYLNFVYTPRIAKKDVEFSFGGMYRHKNRDNYYHHYSLSPVNSGTQMFTDIYSAQYSFKTNGGDDGTGDFGTGRNYSIRENVGAGYGQFKFMASSKLQVLGGLRLETTDQTYSTNLPTNLNAIYGHIYYADLLPSLHFKYKLNNKQNLRLSYFKSLVRPSFVDLIPQLVPASENEAYDQQGNPYVKHTTADNIDLRYEIFPKGVDQILIGGFLKQIHNPIETSFSHYSVTGGNSAPGTNILTPLNSGDVTNYGAELVFTKFFGKFGVNANYTYTHSLTNTTKFFLNYDTTSKNSVTISKIQSRPLQGQAKHIGNLSLLFKDPKTGIDIQLAYVYTGEKLSLLNTFYNLDTWQAPYSQLDLSFEWKIVKKVSIYGKVNNLTNSQTRFFIKQPYLIGNTLNKIPGQDDPANSIFVQRDTYKISYLLGLRFKL